MPKLSAGLLLFRKRGPDLEVLLVHPGGPFWAKRDLGAWSIPKGEHAVDEDPRDTALREFAEETGTSLISPELLPLGEAVQPGRKIVTVFATEAEFDPATLRSNLVEIAWPPRSGRTLLVPEVDRAAWFDLIEAGKRILPGQAVFLERLSAMVCS